MDGAADGVSEAGRRIVCDFVKCQRECANAKQTTIATQVGVNRAWITLQHERGAQALLLKGSVEHTVMTSNGKASCGILCVFSFVIAMGAPEASVGFTRPFQPRPRSNTESMKLCAVTVSVASVSTQKKSVKRHMETYKGAMLKINPQL